MVCVRWRFTAKLSWNSILNSVFDCLLGLCSSILCKLCFWEWVLGWWYTGNFLSNFAGQPCCLTDFYQDILDWSWALCLTWMPNDGNIAQKVAQCIISLSRFFPADSWVTSKIIYDVSTVMETLGIYKSLLPDSRKIIVLELWKFPSWVSFRYDQLWNIQSA